MKSLLLFLLFLITQSSYSQLSQSIHDAQLKCVRTSLFKNAKYLEETLETQKEFREQYLKNLLQIIKEHPRDTIIITERYMFECNGCPAKSVDMFTSCNIYEYDFDFNTMKYNNMGKRKYKEYKFLADETRPNEWYPLNDIKTIMGFIKNKKDINKAAIDYGTEDCYDGNKTVYTVLFPDKKINCLYMRCWNN